jgi:hypothetical protein
MYVPLVIGLYLMGVGAELETMLENESEKKRLREQP